MKHRHLPLLNKLAPGGLVRRGSIPTIGLFRGTPGLAACALLAASFALPQQAPPQSSPTPAPAQPATPGPAQPGQTAQFPAGRLIAGWVEALRRMKEGDEWELVIPAKIGYGARGAGDVIPANQTLVFDMTLVSVAPGQ